MDAYSVACRFFVVSLNDEGTAAAELNGLLRSHRVLAVERHWVEQGAESFWTRSRLDESRPRHSRPRSRLGEGGVM
jgi:hypothetical protein